MNWGAFLLFLLLPPVVAAVLGGLVWSSERYGEARTVGGFIVALWLGLALVAGLA